MLLGVIIGFLLAVAVHHAGALLAFARAHLWPVAASLLGKAAAWGPAASRQRSSADKPSARRAGSVRFADSFLVPVEGESRKSSEHDEAGPVVPAHLCFRPNTSRHSCFPSISGIVDVNPDEVLDNAARSPTNSIAGAFSFHHHHGLRVNLAPRAMQHSTMSDGGDELTTQSPQLLTGALGASAQRSWEGEGTSLTSSSAQLMMMQDDGRAGDTLRLPLDMAAALTSRKSRAPDASFRASIQSTRQSGALQQGPGGSSGLPGHAPTTLDILACALGWAADDSEDAGTDEAHDHKDSPDLGTTRGRDGMTAGDGTPRATASPFAPFAHQPVQGNSAPGVNKPMAPSRSVRFSDRLEERDAQWEPVGRMQVVPPAAPEEPPEGDLPSPFMSQTTPVPVPSTSRDSSAHQHRDVLRRSLPGLGSQRGSLHWRLSGRAVQDKRPSGAAHSDCSSEAMTPLTTSRRRGQRPLRWNLRLQTSMCADSDTPPQPGTARWGPMSPRAGLMTASPAAGAGRRCKVLVVTEDAELVPRLRSALPLEDYDLSHAAAIASVLHMSAMDVQSVPDVVLVDGRINGLTAQRAGSQETLDQSQPGAEHQSPSSAADGGTSQSSTVERWSALDVISSIRELHDHSSLPILLLSSAQPCLGVSESQCFVDTHDFAAFPGQLEQQDMPGLVAAARAGVAALEHGANDYVMLPVLPAELNARISMQLALRRAVQARAEARSCLQLLRAILPDHIIGKLRQGSKYIAEYHPELSVGFVDIVGFTSLSANWPSSKVASLLNQLFSRFDDICEWHGVYHVDTIGDGYMVVCGHDGVSQSDHALKLVRAAIEMLAAASEPLTDGQQLQIRIGINTGPAHSGVLGTKRFKYTLWGDSVNCASRMESTGFPSTIQVSSATYTSCVTAMLQRQSSRRSPARGQGAKASAAQAMDVAPLSTQPSEQQSGMDCSKPESQGGSVVGAARTLSSVDKLGSRHSWTPTDASTPGGLPSHPSSRVATRNSSRCSRYSLDEAGPLTSVSPRASDLGDKPMEIEFLTLGLRQIKGKGLLPTYLVKAGSWEEAQKTCLASQQEWQAPHTVHQGYGGSFSHAQGPIPQAISCTSVGSNVDAAAVACSEPSASTPRAGHVVASGSCESLTALAAQAARQMSSQLPSGLQRGGKAPLLPAKGPPRSMQVDARAPESAWSSGEGDLPPPPVTTWPMGGADGGDLDTPEAHAAAGPTAPHHGSMPSLSDLLGALNGGQGPFNRGAKATRPKAKLVPAHWPDAWEGQGPAGPEVPQEEGEATGARHPAWW